VAVADPPCLGKHGVLVATATDAGVGGPMVQPPITVALTPKLSILVAAAAGMAIVSANTATATRDGRWPALGRPHRRPAP